MCIIIIIKEHYTIGISWCLCYLWDFHPTGPVFFVSHFYILAFLRGPYSKVYPVEDFSLGSRKLVFFETLLVSERFKFFNE